MSLITVVFALYVNFKTGIQSGYGSIQIPKLFQRIMTRPMPCFEPLTEEHVTEILNYINPRGFVAQLGGQTLY